MRITPLGAAGEVTGSAYLVETSCTRMLVDFGQFQGGSEADAKNRDLAGLKPGTVESVVLTHAHIDHSGRLPLLVREGFHGKVYATPATVDLAEVLLLDSARIHEGDADRQNRRMRRAGRESDFVEPLFTGEDVEALTPLWRPLAIGRPQQVADGVEATCFEAGHILGSTSVSLRIEDGERTWTVVFSGDIGPRDAPILRDPDPPTRADLVFLESTYGDREHPSREEAVGALKEAIGAALAEKGRVLIPAFAVGRTQLMLFYIAEMVRSGSLPDVPVYLDSPMASRATDVYASHQRLYDQETKALVDSGQVQRDLRHLRALETPDESRALNETWEPCVIIAGSGMCDGGRIIHHLKHHLWRRNVTVLLPGFMAAGTLGRRLSEGADEVHIFGEPIAVRAKVRQMAGFSAHADRAGLLEWLGAMADGGPKVALTHGETHARESLAAAIGERYGLKTVLPGRGEAIEPG